MSERRLTAKQQRFVEEFLVDLNSTAAYIRAGYRSRGNSAEANGNRLRTGNDQVRAAIDAAIKARSERTEITVDKVLTEVSILAHSCVTNYVIDDNCDVQLASGAPADAMRAVRSIKRRVRTNKDGSVTREVELTLWDKPKSLDLEGSHLGMWKAVQVTAPPPPLFSIRADQEPSIR